MTKLVSHYYILLAAAVVVMLACSSCVQHRQLVNFREVKEEPPLDGYTAPVDLPAPIIQPDDILYITVNSLNDEASRPYNMSTEGNNIRGGGGGGGGGGGFNPLLLQGYTVDSLGYIEYPNIGRIQVGGLTIEAARERIAAAVKPFLRGVAVVNVKFLNFRYTIIGDVNLPGTYSTVNERVSVLEALGTAGDLTNYANRETILLIREEGQVRRVVRLNLQDKDFFNSPYYYLQQNDVIYVEPIQAKVATVADPLNRFIGYGSAFLSVVTLALTFILR